MSVTFMESSSPPNEGRTITPVHNLGAVKQMFDKLAALAEKEPSELTPSTFAFQPDTQQATDVIKAALSSRHGVELVMHLPKPDARTCLDLLDQTVNAIEPGSPQYTTMFHLLQKLSHKYETIPKSFILSTDELEKTSVEYVKWGGYADVWTG
ncbi:hypothetical protein AcW1_010012 [Taiwanofungus camphoratus]|nr:hypothetical protein AcV5_003155 [Antrodia cinnamomea]KAI0929524.1 hypothetical protein AcV7_005357 [Antrodia cinnamomea]KAI0946583.1 hypothetical protein AcW1_010012 [Antrodia cinnamomea]